MIVAVCTAGGCSSGPSLAPPAGAQPLGQSYAVLAEFARTNKLMKPGLNRRVFNVVESQAGNDIQLSGDRSSVFLEPGTYEIRGFSMVTMQTTLAPPAPKFGSNYPGYCLLYPVAAETGPHDMGLVAKALAVGSPATALDTVPSLFEAVCTFPQRTQIALGHQSGGDLHDEVYLDVYDVEGVKSDYHVFARLAIYKMPLSGSKLP